MDLRARAEEILDDLVVRFPIGYRPVILWKGLRVSAGYAYYKQRAIGLSTRLIIDEERLVDTLLHEYAHLLAVARHGNHAGNHGPAWQKAMRDLGREPIVRHTYEVERNARRQQVIYKCTKCAKEFARGRKLPRGRKYLHAACGGPIKLVRVESAE